MVPWLRDRPGGSLPPRGRRTADRLRVARPRLQDPSRRLRNVTAEFQAGMLADIATLPPTIPIAQQKGAEPLTPEESMNLTVGAVFRRRACRGYGRRRSRAGQDRTERRQDPRPVGFSSRCPGPTHVHTVRPRWLTGARAPCPHEPGRWPTDIGLPPSFDGPDRVRARPDGRGKPCAATGRIRYALEEEPT